MIQPRILVCVPTYNERENIAPLICSLFALKIPNLEVLVSDDESPDSTADTVQALKSSYRGLHILRRHPPYGRGAAGKEAFIYALAKGFDTAIEMDADFSHNPSHIPLLLTALKDADLVIGSRLVTGGSDKDRSIARRLMTQAANFYVRSVLKLSLQDVNSGYRAWSRKALAAIRPETLKSLGPAIVHEALFRAVRADIRIKEIPIEFIDRKTGKSKLNLWKIVCGYLWILRLVLFG